MILTAAGTTAPDAVSTAVTRNITYEMGVILPRTARVAEWTGQSTGPLFLPDGEEECDTDEHDEQTMETAEHVVRGLSHEFTSDHECGDDGERTHVDRGEDDDGRTNPMTAVR